MDRRRILTAATLRAFATGLVGVTLGIYLAALGLGEKELGLVIGVGLAGNAVSIAIVAAAAERWGRRGTLVLVSALSALGLAAMAAVTSPAWLWPAAFLGMVNGMGHDRGAAQAIDQAILADEVADHARTGLFVRYTLLQDVAAAVGSLALGLAGWLPRAIGVTEATSYRWLFALSALVAAVQVLLYGKLDGARDGSATVGIEGATSSRAVAAASAGGEGAKSSRFGPAPVSAAAKRRVAGLSALFAVDSIGGGLLAGAILSYWFFRRFGLGPEAVGGIFFAARALNALSYLAAGRLARRIGLVRTMVFTHLPASGLLLTLPFIGPVALAVAVFLLREGLVEMDVPTRQSYVAAIVAPHERTFALATTSLVRYSGWALGPALAGLAMSAFGLGAPLVAGAGLKILYDLGLFAAFRRVRPPEETASSAAS